MCVVLHNTTQHNTTQHTMCEQTGLLCECAGCSIAVLIDDTQWVRGKDYCYRCVYNLFIVCNGCENQLHREHDDVFMMVSGDKEFPYCNNCLSDGECAEDDY